MRVRRIQVDKEKELKEWQKKEEKEQKEREAWEAEVTAEAISRLAKESREEAILAKMAELRHVVPPVRVFESRETQDQSKTIE